MKSTKKSTKKSIKKSIKKNKGKKNDKNDKSEKDKGIETIVFKDICKRGIVIENKIAEGGSGKIYNVSCPGLKSGKVMKIIEYDSTQKSFASFK